MALLEKYFVWNGWRESFICSNILNSETTCLISLGDWALLHLLFFEQSTFVKLTWLVWFEAELFLQLFRYFFAFRSVPTRHTPMNDELAKVGQRIALAPYIVFKTQKMINKYSWSLNYFWKHNYVDLVCNKYFLSQFSCWSFSFKVA